jgi:orotate phosphoribosyltransferase
MNTYDQTDNIVRLHTASRTDPDVTAQLELFPAGDRQQPADSSPAPAQSLMTLPRPRPNEGTSSLLALVPPATGSGTREQLRLFSDAEPTDTIDGALATRLATAPGLVQAGSSRWDGGRTPIHPLSLESAYADPLLLRDLGARGARFARDLGVDVVVGAETAGVPLAAAVSLAAELPFAFVRKPGYRGHEPDEPRVRGAQVAGRRALLVDDAVSSGTAVERFTAALAGAGAEVVAAFVLVDMRDVADTVTSVAAALPTESVGTYLQVLSIATAKGLLDPAVHKLSVDAILNRWAEDDPRWDLLPMSA